METSDQRRGETATVYELADDESISTGVVTAVATAADAEMVPTGGTAGGTTALDPLYTAVDPDALDALFGSDGFGTAGTPDRVTFTYHGYEITITGDRRIGLERLERAAGEPAE
ncbi:hypothetical protein C488_18050 [Natrinema pellirubrum DSM 15624]|uniref:Halobacterial output domain-containing protein n=1 Tax=Natrinema pellirubrum (strain DSM 15624 / CIP 106293 / JCM 10476 / NCIMB 786 / 157) TaxID=797303 RepID=L0JQH1_NATP1|nr:HalOD1 output domain-containing protein [Natrinema pellirubrum]AGB33484.1 hypothetical protein Natpe_3722 [Natrinema pellirubrum DSM 15624]ELY70715.1 hypothetical protein C488_18050 [Natrinema pellirubrum DSM 15624]